MATEIPFNQRALDVARIRSEENEAIGSILDRICSGLEQMTAAVDLETIQQLQEAKDLIHSSRLIQAAQRIDDASLYLPVLDLRARLRDLSGALGFVCDAITTRWPYMNYDRRLTSLGFASECVNDAVLGRGWR